MRAHGRWLVLFSIVAAFAGCRHPAVMVHDSGEWGGYDVVLPRGEAQALAFLLSPASGIGADDRAAAAALTHLGVAVAIVDTRIYLERMGHAGTTCLEVPGPFLWTSHMLEKELGFPAYRAPYLVGRGAGGLLAYAALAQSPARAIAGGASVDLDDRVLPIARPLCGLRTNPTHGGRRLGMYRLGAEWELAGTRRLASAVRSWGAAVSARNRHAAGVTPAIHAYPTLVPDVVGPMLSRAASTAASADAMPVVEVKSVSAHGVLAVIFSGDGGWRDIDKSVGGYLAEHGLAVLGVDALSYFWEKRTPDQVGADTAAMLREYLRTWRQRHVALVGYSFGADILPFVYTRLPPDLQKHVVLVSLLAPGRAIDFEVHVTNWLGGGPDADALAIPPELARVPDEKVQCIYGDDEADESLCTDASVPAATVVHRPGDHHFDGDYEGLGAVVLDGILRRVPHTPAR